MQFSKLITICVFGVIYSPFNLLFTIYKGLWWVDCSRMLWSYSVGIPKQAQPPKNWQEEREFMDGRTDGGR